MNETEAAWMAGFIDGEGTLTILKVMVQGSSSPRYRATAQITNSNLEALRIFQQFYGGSIRNIYDWRLRALNWAQCYEWRCPGGQMQSLLSDIYPYLVIKKPNADIIMELIHSIERVKCNYKKGGGRAPISEEETNYREGLRLEIHSLNRKGKGGQANEIA